MPAKKINVNLLEKDALSESPVGRIVVWATTYGRYIMITTEILVLLAFISRFSLDRKLTDLNESIAQKQAIIEANIPFEQEYLSLQNEISKIKNLTQDQSKHLDTLNNLKSILPNDVYFDLLQIDEAQATGKVLAGSVNSFAIFINNLQKSPQFADVEITDVKKKPPGQIEVRFTTKFKSKKIENRRQETGVDPDNNL